MDYSLPGSSVHGILQARILEWVAISFSRSFKLRYILTKDFSFYKIHIIENSFSLSTRLSFLTQYYLVQFSSVTQLCLTLCDPMNHCMPGLLVHHQLLGVYSNSCPLSRWYHPTISSSVVLFSSGFNLSQHQGLFEWVSSSHQVLAFQLQHQSFQWTLRTDLL